MAYLRVDHSKFEAAASAIDTYVTSMKNKMRSAGGEVNTLSANWQGSDFTQFKAQWDKVTNNDSTYSQMIKSLESYAKYLRFAAQKYKEAQSKAVNRANGLPKY